MPERVDRDRGDPDPVRSPTSARRAVAAWITRADRSWTGTVARVALASTVAPHGLGDGLGIDGGPGIAAYAEGCQRYYGVPWIVGAASIGTQLVGPVFLVLGLGTRIWGAVLCLVALFDAWTLHARNGYFMNWSGLKAGEGYEHDLLVAATGVIVMLAGGGRLSLDRALTAASDERRRNP